MNGTFSSRLVKIGERIIAPERPAFVIAEAGVNHNGSLETAIELVRAAADAGADAVKFQTWKTEKIITPTASKADYQRTGSADEETQYDMLKRLELDYDAFRCIQRECDRAGIFFLSTPDEEESAAFLANIGVPAIKIGSGELTNLPYLKFLASLRKPLLLSTGMSDIAEIQRAVEWITTEDEDASLVILQCTSLYPAEFDEINLSAIHTLARVFGYPVGFSDHTKGIEIAIAARVFGACVIEKHFTLDRGMPGPDHAASLEPTELRAMISALHHVEAAMGDGIKRPNQREYAMREVVRKRLAANRRIPAGDTITADDVSAKRGGAGIEPGNLSIVIGRQARLDIAQDEFLTWSKI